MMRDNAESRCCVAAMPRPFNFWLMKHKEKQLWPITKFSITEVKVK
jgi:hypothetical protein